MGNKTLALILAIATHPMLGCISADTEDTTGAEGETRQEIGLTYSGNEDSQELQKLPELDTKQLEASQLQAAVLGPAQGVTYFQTYAVGSSNIGWEYVSDWQLITAYDHGGALLRVAVLQYGYGNGGASLNGASGVNYLTEYLCGSLSTLHYCSNGEIVTGQMSYYSFDGMQGGSFSAFTNSYAYPYGQMTDSITIR
jgi:hypothetical protein